MGGLLLAPRLARENLFPGSDESMIFVRSNNVSRPVVASGTFRAGRGPREASSGRTGDVVGVQSIASSSSSSRDRNAGTCAGVDDAGGDGGLKVAGLSEARPKTGPVACHVRNGNGAEERERLSSSSGGSRVRGVLVVMVVVEAEAAGAYEGGGEREGREVLVLGVLEREVDESIRRRRTAGARWRRRVKKEYMNTCEGVHQRACTRN